MTNEEKLKQIAHLAPKPHEEQERIFGQFTYLLSVERKRITELEAKMEELEAKLKARDLE